jgi:hypothetical protein
LVAASNITCIWSLFIVYSFVLLKWWILSKNLSALLADETFSIIMSSLMLF